MGDGSAGPRGTVAAGEERLRAALAAQLERAVERDGPCRRQLRAWAESLAGADPDAAVQLAAAREANRLANHARFRLLTGRDPPEALRETPVAPYRSLGPAEAVADALDDLRGALGRDPPADADDVGARYETALTEGERRTRGQFYTPRPVAVALARWALDGAGDRPRVLDPAAGTGTFPLAVYDYLRERHPDAAPSSLLAGLVAVDVDAAALHLAGLRLSARTGGRPVDASDRRACSFFDLSPGPAREADDPRNVLHVDAVVGNPPFVRAGDLAPDREHFRAHLDAFGPDGRAAAGGDSRYAGGDAALSRRSDAYVYFVTQATRFLRPGGRLGVVLPAKWLGSEYGIGFRKFLAEQYDVRAVVGFGARAFDALVDTVLLLAERRAEPRLGGSGVNGGDPAAGDVSFVRLEAPLDASTSLAEVVEGGGSTPATDPADPSGGRARVVRRDRSAFASAEKCSPYLRAPSDLVSLLDHPGFVPLGDLAHVSRGVTTGANRFFLLDADDRDRWGIDPAVLRPAVRSIRGVESRTVSAEDVDLAVVDVHDFLGERGGRGHGDDDGADPARRAKDALREAGHDAFVDYVEGAEAEGVHEGRTCRTRKVWFDLGPLPTPDAFVPKLLRERVFTVRNRAGAVPTNAIDCLSVREGVDPDVLLGVLDSSLSRASMEIWGRNEAGMLQLMTYETRTLPVPDVRGFPSGDAATVAEAARALDADGTGQAALDAAVHAAAGVDLSPERAREMRERLLSRRVEGGDRVEVPVS